MYIGLFFPFIGYAISRILIGDYIEGLLTRLPGWLNKPLGLCGVCLTGQLSLWGLLPFVTWDYRGVVTYVGIISLNMIVTKILIYAEKD